MKQPTIKPTELHAKCRPPRGATVIGVFDLESWGDIDDGKPHHALLCADPTSEDRTHAIAYVAPCACVGANAACPQWRILGLARVFFDGVSIIEVKPPAKRRR